MDPNKIELGGLEKSFEYERFSRIIDECNDIDILKNMAKSYIKLYLKQQEVVSQLGQLGVI